MTVRGIRSALKRAGLTALSFELTVSLGWKVVLVDLVPVTQFVEQYTLVAAVAERKAETIEACKQIEVSGNGEPLILQAQSYDIRNAYTEICFTAVRNGD